jgi:hypothetical protein
MIALLLIEDARAAGCSIKVEDGDLVVEADRDPPAELIASLRPHKAELIAALTLSKATSTDFAAGSPTAEEAPPSTWDDGEGEERAAIVEYDGKIPRAWAEGFARLHPDRSPGDVPVKRWQTFVDDCGRFLDDGWAETAASLGWGPLDLFGCNRDRPFARIDKAGLLWLLNGNRLVALSENTASIETRTGTRQIYRRESPHSGRVLAWELLE